MLRSKGGGVLLVLPIPLIQSPIDYPAILKALIPLPRIALRARQSPGASKIKVLAPLPPVLRHKKFPYSRALSLVLQDARFLPVPG